MQRKNRKNAAKVKRRVIAIILAVLSVLIMVRFNVLPEVTKRGLAIDLSVLHGYKEVYPGEEIWAMVTIYNPEGVKQDMVLKSYIMDLKRNVISVQKRTLTVQTSASVIATLPVPGGTEPGLYTLNAEIVLGGVKYSASESFRVLEKEHEEKPLAPDNKIFIILLVITALLIAIFFQNLKLAMRHNNKKR